MFTNAVSIYLKGNNLGDIVHLHTEYVHLEFIYFTKMLVLTDWFSPFILLFPTWNYHEIILIDTEI
jgi:hypothetical protein